MERFIVGVLCVRRPPPPRMASACAWLSLDAVHIVFATAQLMQQRTCFTFARHVLVKPKLYDPRLPMDTLHALSALCMRDIAIV